MLGTQKWDQNFDNHPYEIVDPKILKAATHLKGSRGSQGKIQVAGHAASDADVR